MHRINVKTNSEIECGNKLSVKCCNVQKVEMKRRKREIQLNMNVRKITILFSEQFVCFFTQPNKTISAQFYVTAHDRTNHF